LELLQILTLATAGLLAIACSTLLAPRIGVAAPLVLVLLGVAVSLLPTFADFAIEPEWVLAGLLPPLLYSAAVSMPTMNFRREFSAISGLSVVLIIACSLILGLFFMLVLPSLGFAWGVALGAILSPTDAVATSMIKGKGVSKRVVALLEGESLLNDATALVLLRTAIIATAATFSFWGALGTFVYSVLIACLFGAVIGWLNLLARSRVTNSTANTVISFTVPFLASIPVEMLGGSGLVAAVVAGLVTGVRGPRELSPQNRLSDTQNWRTVELVLEGIVFLTMGLQLTNIVAKVVEDNGSVVLTLLIAAGALVLTVLIRAAYVFPLLWLLGRRARRGANLQAHLESLRDQMSTEDGKQQTLDRMRSKGWRGDVERNMEGFVRRIARGLADLDYFLRQPLGWRDGVLVIWAGMRGAITVAAAQTLPEDTPLRSMVVLIAFGVALGSLLLQGGTMLPLLRALTPRGGEAEADGSESGSENIGESGDESGNESENAEGQSEPRRLMQLLRDTASAFERPQLDASATRTSQFEAARAYRISVIEAQRTAILDARDTGTFDAELLAHTLDDLDASQIAIEMRATHVSND